MESNCSMRKNPLVKQTSERLYNNRHVTGDIILKIDNVEIPAHKCILAAISPKYQRQFFGNSDDENYDFSEFKEPTVSAAAFNEYLKFFYFDEVKLTHENIADVFILCKECQVDEFYNECISFIRETLSIENVCQMYELAKRHDYDELLVSCTRLITSNLDVIFKTVGFLRSNRTTISHILRLIGVNCPAKCVFDACIAWARKCCEQSDQDPNSNENLRAMLGDLLYAIRFDTMAFEEFIHYYRPFKSLFTEDERDEILQLIGKVTDFQPKWFKCDQHSPSSVGAKHRLEDTTQRNTQRRKRIKTNEFIDCVRICFKMPSQTSYEGVYKSSFTCSDYLELNTIFCGTLYDDQSAGGEGGQSPRNNSVRLKITILEKLPWNQSKKATKFEEVQTVKFQRDLQTGIKLSQPIRVSPLCINEISIEFFERIHLQSYELKNQIDFGQGITVRFHDSIGPITWLRFST